MGGAFSDFFGTPDPDRYEADRHPDLPYGYWLTSAGEIPGEPPLVDEEGQLWGSVREEFWQARLGMPESFYVNRREILEFMLHYLAIIDGRFVERSEKATDVFLGNRHFGDFFEAFLSVAGLVDHNGRSLTTEGRAVLLMLFATRTQDDAREGVGLDWIAATRTVAGGWERETAADRVTQHERIATRMANRFTTGVIDGVPVVKLIALRITSEVPVRSTIWTMTWDDRDAHARNEFYLWLLERIDRWDAWSAMVTDHGIRALTEHFMKLAFCDRFSVTHRHD